MASDVERLGPTAATLTGLWIGTTAQSQAPAYIVARFADMLDLLVALEAERNKTKPPTAKGIYEGL